MQEQLHEQQTICPVQPDKPNAHRWCTFEVNNPATATIQYVYLSCLIILSIVLIRFVLLLVKYRKSHRYRQYFGNMYVWIYTIVSLWLFFTFVRVISCLIVYNVYMKQDFPEKGQDPHSNDPPITSPLVILSCLYNFLNSTTAFFINLAMVLIPYHWIKIQLQIVNESQMLDEQARKNIDIWMSVVNFARIYFKYIRNIFPALLLAQPVFFYLVQQGRCMWVSVNLYFIIGQAILFLIFYLFGAYVTYYLQKRQLIKMQPKQSFRIKMQYLALFIVLVVRVTRNFLTVYQIINQNDNLNGNCSNMTKQPLVQVLVLCFHHSFMHLLPISIILFIYQPNLKKLRKYEDSLDIDSTSDAQGQSNYKAIARGFYKSSLVTQSNRSNLPQKSSSPLEQ